MKYLLMTMFSHENCKTSVCLTEFHKNEKQKATLFDKRL